MAKLSEEDKRLLEDHVDANGRIIPTRQAFERVTREYPTRSPADQLRLAQAQTLIDVLGGRRAKELMKPDDSQ